jgi:hypothetical protein
MIEKCPGCGKELEEDFSFCPGCGKELTVSEASKKPVKKETKKKEKTTFTLPKVSFDIPRKTALGVFAVVCFAILVGVGLLVVSPFETTGVDASVGTVDIGGRVFPVSIENTLTTDIECYLKVGPLKFCEFVVPAEDTLSIDVIEDNLKSYIQRDTYDITLYATLDYTFEATAVSVTESAAFSILEGNGEYYIETANAL